MSEDQKGVSGVSGPSQPLGEYFGNIRVLGELSRNGLNRPWLTSLPKDLPPHRYVVWLGCNMVRTAHLAESLDDILKALDVDFVSLGGPSHCCGIMHEARGEVAVANNMLRNTMKKFDAFEAERLLVWCPSCDNQIATRNQETVTETAKERGRVADFLARAVPTDRLAPVPMTVAIHHHGDFLEQQEDAKNIHDLLARIPGLNIIDMPPATGLGRHCTGDVIGKVGRYAYQQRMAEWDAEARRRGAAHTISLYHSCHRQLVLLQRGTESAYLPVVNYLTVLARALGLPEREDRFTHLSKLEDVDAMAVAVAPQADALDVKPDQVRRALVDQFLNRS